MNKRIVTDEQVHCTIRDYYGAVDSDPLGFSSMHRTLQNFIDSLPEPFDIWANWIDAAYCQINYYDQDRTFMGHSPWFDRPQPPAPKWMPKKGEHYAFWCDVNNRVYCRRFKEITKEGQLIDESYTPWQHCAAIDTLGDLDQSPEWFIKRDGRWI